MNKLIKSVKQDMHNATLSCIVYNLVQTLSVVSPQKLSNNPFMCNNRSPMKIQRIASITHFVIAHLLE
jgi:hypothetical protein